MGENMETDIEAYKQQFPKAHLKRKIKNKDEKDFTKKFKMWMRDRLKKGEIKTLWAEPDIFYNETTKKFIKKSGVFFDKRTKKLTLKKKFRNEYFLEGSRLIKDQAGLITFTMTYDYKKKNTETGQFYDIIQTRTKTHTIKTRKSRALQDAEKFVQMEKERLEKESSMFLQDADTKIQNATFINYKNKNVSLFDEPMKYSGALDLDGEMKNAEWCRDRGMCVYDFLQYRYGDKDKFKKITKDERMTEIFKNVKSDNICTFYKYQDPEKNGVCVRQLRAWCDVAGVSLYCLDCDEKIFHHHKPEKNAKQSPVVFRIKNGHFYPITDKCKVKSICERQKDKIVSDLAEKRTKKATPLYECVFMDNTTKDNKRANETQFLINKIEETGTAPYPLEHITMNEGTVIKFKLNDKLYICDTKKNNDNVMKYCKDKNIPYQGETAVGLLKLQLKNTYGENWTAVFNSQFNPHVRKLLTYENVKHRTHYGATIDNIDEVMNNSHNVLCWDVKRCYSKAMYDPLEEWLIYGFNDVVEKVDEINLSEYEGKLPNGLYYVETSDMSLLHGNNWYSSSILNKFKAENIKTPAVVMWELVPVNNKKYTTDADNVKVDNVELFTHLIDKITDDTQDYPDLQKLMINSISGLMGKTDGKCLKVDIDNNINRVYDMIADRAGNPDFFIENLDIKDQKYYMYGKTERTQYSEIALPIYIQILDRGNMLLFDMVKAMGGECIYRKTDCAITINSTGQLKEGDAKWGEWRESEFPTRFSTMAPASERHVPAPTQIKDYEYLPHNDSDQAEDIKKDFINGKGLMLLGRAGTGKTYVALKLAEATGAKKLAFTNKACLCLDGTTIHKYLSITKNGNIDMNWVRKQNYKYYVIDEISMISGHLWRLLCELKRLTGATFLLVGDYRQLPPVEESGVDYFEHPAIKYLCNSTRCELTHMKRYDMELWETSEKVYNDETYQPTELYQEATIQQMSERYNICYTNRTRKQVNKAVNDYMTKKKKYIDIEYTGDKKEPPQSVRAYVGLPLIARQNLKSGEMVNNECFTVKEIKDNSLTASNDRNEIEIKLDEFHKYFLMGYCSTAHKSQGETIDGHINIFDWGIMDKHLKYTAITRTTKKQYVHIIF